MVCNLLTQIFVTAERTRAAKASVQGPLSLIELIPASYAVFERFGIGPPDDAVYHRYLLSLSINPERDWRRKIRNFDLGTQPRVKRLCSTGGHRHAAATDAQAADSGVQRRQEAESKQSVARRASLLSEALTPIKKPAPSSGILERQRDRFGDMLSLDSPLQNVQDGPRAFTRATTRPLGSENDEKRSVGRVGPMPKDEDSASNIEGFTNQKERIAAGERQLQMITTSIEQWRATQKVKQLVNQNKLQDRQRQMIPLCTRAVFHWVALCLPEKRDFHATESPRDLPLCVLRRISVDVKVLKKSASKLWLWQMKKLLKTWHEDAHRLQAFRVRMIVKQRASVLELAFQCIQRWRLFTETKKCSDDRAQWIAQRRSRSKLRICLQHWRVLYQARQRQLQAAQYHKRRVFRGVLKSWQSVVESNQEERKRYARARKRRCFSTWKREIERRQTSRALLCVSDGQRRLRTLSESWNRLRANVARNRIARTRMELWEASSCRRRRRQMLRCWKEVVGQKGAFREREERFQRYRRRRRLGQTFVSWATWTERQSSVAKLLADAAQSRGNQRLVLCFTGWRKHCKEAAIIEETIVAGVVRMRRRKVWEQWRKRTGTRSATRYLDAAYSLHLKLNIFATWHQYAVKKMERRFAFLECEKRHKRRLTALHWRLLVGYTQLQREKERKADMLSLKRLDELKRECLTVWQGHAHRKRALRAQGEQVRHSVRRGKLIRSSWLSWRRAFWLRNVSQLADNQLFTYRKSRAFRLWKEFLFQAKQRRARTLKVVDMLGDFHLHACLRQWKEIAAYKRRLVKKGDLVQGMIYRRWWATWRHTLRTKRGQHEKLSVVASRWQNRQLFSSFHRWKATWKLRKRHRQLLLSTLLTSNQRVLEAHFSAWERRWQASVSDKQQGLEAQEKLLRFKAKRAIRRWGATRLDQHRRSCLLVKALALWRQTLLSSAFRCFVVNQQRRKKRKTRAQLAQAHYRTHSMQLGFGTWSQRWRRKDKLSRKLEAARRQLDRLRMLRGIEGLRRNAQSAKRLRRAHACVVALSSGNVKGSSFARWKAFVVQIHSNRVGNAVRAASMRTFRVGRKIRRWRQVVQVQKMLKLTLARAVVASTASQLQLHFKNWKAFIKRRKFVRALEKKAAAFHCFCLLPLHFKAWKAFLAAKKHKRELLLRARGLWCQQAESRAFQAWVRYTDTNHKTKHAVAKWRNQTIARSFASWKRFEAQQKRKDRDEIRAVNFYQQRRSRRMLGEWRLTTRCARLSRRCAEMWRQTASRTVFDAWTRHVKLMQSSRKFVANLRNQILVKVFTAWKERIVYKTQKLQGIQERFALLWMVDTRVATFERWKRYARLHSFIRRKLTGQREILLQELVENWKRVTTSRQRSTQNALIVAQRAKRALLWTFWSDWRGKARLLRCVEALRGKVTENRVSTDLRDRLRRWKQYTLLSRAVKGFVRHQDLKFMRLVFIDGFRRFSQLKRKERVLIEKIGSVHEVYLKNWLARKLQQRMSVIAACEDIRSTGNSRRLLTESWSGWMDLHERKQTQKASIRQLRVQISRLEDHCSPLDTAVLSGMLRRWQAIQVARVFERWNEGTQAQQQARTFALKAMEWWQKTQCEKYFQGWTRFCFQQRKQRQIRAMSSKNKLQRTWKHWQTFKTVSQSKKIGNLCARQLYTKHVYQSSLKTWRDAATSLRLKREQILELYHSSRLRLLAALLEEWRKFAALERTERMQKTVARVVYQQKLLRSNFDEWKANVAGICSHRRQLQINTERLQVLLLCSSFRAWHSWSRQHKTLKKIMRVLANKSDNRAASRVLTAWHSHADKTSRLRHQASSFLRFRRMQKAVTALKSLVQEQQFLLSVREKAQLFRAALSDHRVALVFSQWRRHAALSRKTRIVTLRYLHNKLLPAAWKGWAHYVQRKRARRDKTLTAALSWKNASLRKVWNALVLAHNVEKQRHATVTQAETHFRNRRLRKALTEWRGSSQESRHFRAVCGARLSRWRLQAAYRCFCALRDHAVRRRTLRSSEDLVRTKARTTALLGAWYAWRKLILVLRSGKRRSLQRCWASWTRSHESRKALQGFQRLIQERVLRSTQRRCLADWKEYVAVAKIEKAMLVMSTAFAATQRLKRVWLCWIKYIAKTRAATSLMRDALIRMQLQLQFKAFRALQTYTKLQINRRRKLCHCLNVMQHSVQAKSFGAWLSFVARRKTLRVKVAQSLAMRSQLGARRVFQTWESFVKKTQRSRIAQAFNDAKVSAHALKHWRQHVVLCKVEKMIGTSELRNVESSFLRWRKAVAATLQIRVFRAKSTRRQWLEVVGRVFTSWKQRSETHAHCRKLLASVAVGNHIRFRFMVWQRFTTHRKRLATLLLVVADPPATSPVEAQTCRLEGEELESDGVVNGEELDTTSSSSNERELVSLGQQLAKKARVLQRFDVTWDLPEAWHRWRQIFHAQLFYRMRRLQLHFLCWQKFARRQRRSRWIVIKLTTQRQAASAQSLFRAWATLVARVKQLQKDRLREREVWVLVTTEMARRERRELKKHWHAWKFHAEEARHLQTSLDAYHRSRSLTKHWLVWRHDYRQIKSEERREAQRVDAHMQSFRLRRAVRSLNAHQRRRKRARLVLEYFGNRHYDKLLPDVFSSWRTWCQRQKEVACWLEAARRNRTRRHLTAWKLWGKTRKGQRVVVNNLQSKSIEQRRRDVWMRWRRYVKTRVAKDLALQKAAIFHVCLRLRKRWLRHAQRAIQLREHSETAHVQLCALRGRRAVKRWRELSRSRRLRRLYLRFVLRKHVQLWQSAVKHAVATRFDAFLLRSKAKKMLAAWQQLAAKHRHWCKLCASFVGKKETQTTRRVFVRWQQLVNACQGKRLAAMHAEQRLLRHVWRCWNRATLASQLQRHDQLEQAAEHEAVTLLRQSLCVWQAAVQKQRERRVVLLSCVVKIKSVASHRAQEVVFRSWKRFIDRERSCGAALFKRDCNTVRRALSFWLVWMRSRQQRRQQLESADEYRSQRLKSGVFFYWQTYALAWQDAAKPLARLHRQMTLPARIDAEPRATGTADDSDDSEADVRRPTSPVMKRLRQKKGNRTGDADASGMVTLPDAVEISMDVKKRLLLLGKWKPQPNGKPKSKFLSSST